MSFERLIQNVSKKGQELFAAQKARFFPTGPRFVLFIGDEGAILVYVKDGVVKSRQFIPDTKPEHLESLRESMAMNPRAALMVVVDTIDQSYIQQTLPPVSALSIKKLVRRRLERDFSADDVKGAVILGRDPGGRKDWNFMMISLERTPLLSAWIDFISSLPNRFQGFYLVAAESEMLIKQLEREVGKHDGRSEWKFFVSHNKVSGFRQVILRNGKVVFTRMAQPVGEMTPEVMAGNIEQEMLSTIEYMRRLSFDPQTGLDIYIITSNAIRTVLDTAKFGIARHVHVMTPYEAAQHLDIEGATQPADQFGDVVLAASIGRSTRHVLTLHTTESYKFHQLYQLMMSQRTIAGVIGGCTAVYALALILGMYLTYMEARSQEYAKVEQQKRLESVRLAIRQSAMDVERTNDIIEMYSQLQKERFTPLTLLGKVRSVLKPTILVKGIEVSYEDDPDRIAAAARRQSAVPGQDVAAGGNAPRVSASFTMEFPGVTTLEMFKPISTQLLADLKQVLPGYEASYTRLPNIFSEDERLDMTFSGGKATPVNPIANQSLDVVLTLSGDPDSLAGMPPAAAVPVPANEGAAP